MNLFPFPRLPKRKADVISNGFFLILLGLLFYTDRWWPGILFAIGLTCALRQYLTGRKLDFLITLLLMGILAFIALAGHLFSGFFPFILVTAGLYLIVKETLFFKRKDPEPPSEV